MSAIRVVVVDDQAIVRDGLVTVLSLLPDIEVVGEAEDGAAAVAIVDALEPDVVLMDLRMPRMDGAEATEAILRDHPAVAVLVLTTFADDRSIVSALRAGARGYLTKDAGRVEIAAAIRAVASGQSTFDASVGALLVAGLTGGPTMPAGAGAGAGTGTGTGAGADVAAGPLDVDSLRTRFPELTPRETEVLGRMAAGGSNPEIAADLFLSVPTVKSYVNQIFAKLGVASRAQAITRVLR
ncbi:response regulator transcription factor [Curtobacterium sp. Leaf261]|uniref:response regulator transcription factor n=1 Tax=Curtobacterium sp. Leaf261 TaxID=1736311 RepID=UPI000701EA77|nr:response regulator transcription factor [Curtobacterium sp. Leaf261]KQO63657.1 LuxR family transcriptional regulator [Curtobacterium sp. Leaf261]